jgi:hypothetical protein
MSKFDIVLEFCGSEETTPVPSSCWNIHDRLLYLRTWFLLLAILRAACSAEKKGKVIHSYHLIIY